MSTQLTSTESPCESPRILALFTAIVGLWPNSSIARCTSVLCLFVCSAIGQINQPALENLRPFKSKVEAIAKSAVADQSKLVVNLSRDLMEEGYARKAGKSDVPHFGHLAREMAFQEKFELMCALLKERELSSENYFTVAELLAERLHPVAFELLVTNSSLTMPAPEGQEGHQSGKDIITWEWIPEYSALSLRHYITNEVYRVRVESHLVNILKHHKRTGIRAFAAEALGYSQSGSVIKPLEEAVADKGRVMCVACGNDWVGEYAAEALDRIRKNSTSQK